MVTWEELFRKISSISYETNNKQFSKPEVSKTVAKCNRFALEILRCSMYTVLNYT